MLLRVGVHGRERHQAGVGLLGGVVEGLLAVHVQVPGWAAAAAAAQTLIALRGGGEAGVLGHHQTTVTHAARARWPGKSNNI